MCMSRSLKTCSRVSFLFALLVSPLAQGKVQRLEISEQSAVLEGENFGRSGANERVVGTVFFTLDPGPNANAAIRDLAVADCAALWNHLMK